MARNKPAIYDKGIYIYPEGVYEVWHQGRYVARTKTKEDAEYIKSVAMANSVTGDPMPGVLAGRKAKKVLKVQQTNQKRIETIKLEIQKYRQLKASDITDIAKWVASVTDETPQIFERERTQVAFEFKLKQVRE